MKGLGFPSRKECRWLQCHEAVAEAYACRSSFWKRLCVGCGRCLDMTLWNTEMRERSNVKKMSCFWSLINPFRSRLLRQIIIVTKPPFPSSSTPSLDRLALSFQTPQHPPATKLHLPKFKLHYSHRPSLPLPPPSPPHPPCLPLHSHSPYPSVHSLPPPKV